MLEGEISEIRLIERLVELWHEQFTGAIRFENDGIIKIIYFKGGDILSASTNDRSDSIDEILMRAGKVSRDHVKQALAKRKESETLGDALLNLGFITRKELTWSRRVQVVGVIRSIDGWAAGSFTIVADYLPKRDEGTLFPLPQVLIELIVTDPDRPKFERLLDGGTAVFAKAADFDAIFPRLGLNEDADAIVTLVDGERSASEVATLSGRDAFNVFRLLHALATLGLLVRTEQGSEAALSNPSLDYAAAGVSDAADAWDEPAAGEPAPAAAPIYHFDEAEAARQPTLEVAIDRNELPDYDTTAHSAGATRSAWDEDEDEEAIAPVSSEPVRMPGWDLPAAVGAAAASADAIAMTPEPAFETREPEQWGFDEAQIETARRGRTRTAGAPPSVPPKKGAGRRRLLVGVMALVILLAAGYAAWLYWPREAVEPVTAEQPKPRPRLNGPVPSVAETATIVEVAPDATPTTLTSPPSQPVAAETAPATAPAVVTPRPAPARTAAAPSASAALPAVQPKGSAREKYDAMAREYAAQGGTGFTVQIQILCEASNLDNVIRAGGDDVWFVPQAIGARSCYRVFWGRFDSREAAQRAMSTIPAGLRDPSAAVKAIPGS